MAVSLGMDEINPSGSKIPHKHEYAYSHFAPCNLERKTDRYRLDQCKKLDGFNDSYNPTGYVHIIFALCFALFTGIIDREMQLTDRYIVQIHLKVCCQQHSSQDICSSLCHSSAQTECSKC